MYTDDDCLLMTLRSARDLVAAGWTQDEGARDASSLPCDPLSPDARSYCVLGALDRAAVDCGLTHVSGYRAQKAYGATLGLPEIAEWNDRPTQTRESILAGFDFVIGNLEARVA